MKKILLLLPMFLLTCIAHSQFIYEGSKPQQFQTKEEITRTSGFEKKFEKYGLKTSIAVKKNEHLSKTGAYKMSMSENWQRMSVEQLLKIQEEIKSITPDEYRNEQSSLDLVIPIDGFVDTYTGDYILIRESANKFNTYFEIEKAFNQQVDKINNLVTISIPITSPEGDIIHNKNFVIFGKDKLIMIGVYSTEERVGKFNFSDLQFSWQTSGYFVEKTYLEILTSRDIFNGVLPAAGIGIIFGLVVKLLLVKRKR